MNRFNAALVVRWIFSLLWHVLNIIIWVIYVAITPNYNDDKSENDSVAIVSQNYTTTSIEVIDNGKHKSKDRNHLWILHGLYFTSFILTFLSLISLQTFNIDLIENSQIIHENRIGDSEQSNKQSNSIEIERQTYGQRFVYNALYFWKQLKHDIMSLTK